MSKHKLTDFYDAHHLRYCDESYLDRRILPMETAFNMRDIGGYTNKENKRLKWNKIYRGEELRHLDDKDHKEFEKLGLDYIFDFRGSANSRYYPDHIPEGAKYVNLPVLDNLRFPNLDPFETELNPETISNYMKGLYYAQVDQRADMFAKVLKVLRDEPEAKIYIHCTNGKDRTGFMIALIMLLAGIDKDKIISEYSLTNHNFDKAYATLAEQFGNITNTDSDERDFYGVDPDWLEVQLNYIEENYGNVDNYLTENTDLTKEDLDTIRDNILESQ